MAKDKHAVKELKKYSFNPEVMNNSELMSELTSIKKLFNGWSSAKYVFNHFIMNGIEVFCVINLLDEMETFVIDTKEMTKTFTHKLYDIESEDVIPTFVRDEYMKRLDEYVALGFLDKKEK